jgi:hypothetical protein
MIYDSISNNKTENHFSLYPRSHVCTQDGENINSAGLRPVIKFVTFLQGCRECLHGKGAIC